MQPNVGHPYIAPQPPRKRRVWPWILVAAVIGLCAIGGLAIAAAGVNGAAKSLATSMPSTPVTKKPAAKSGALQAGDYVVGRDVKAGTYNVTTGPDGINCYWARVKAFDGDLESVLANGNVQPGQKAKITIKATDHGLDLQGDCAVTASK